MQEICNSIANTLELRLSCTNPSIWLDLCGLKWFFQTYSSGFFVFQYHIILFILNHHYSFCIFGNYLISIFHIVLLFLYFYDLLSFVYVFIHLCAYSLFIGRAAQWITHWGRVTHICFSKLTIIGSDNGLSPGRRQAIIWTNDGILLIRTVWTHFSEIVSKIHTFSFKKMHFKMSSGKWRPSCLGLNVLMNK